MFSGFWFEIGSSHSLSTGLFLHGKGHLISTAGHLRQAFVHTQAGAFGSSFTFLELCRLGLFLILLILF